MILAEDETTKIDGGSGVRADCDANLVVT